MEDVLLFLIKILLTVFIVILLPIYKRTYGYQNFLWLSDIGLFLTIIALWIQSSLLISIAVILILPFEIVWMIDFFFQLLTRKKLLGIVDYMFNQQYSLYIRLFSLFHIVVPIIWIWCLLMWGYNNNAFQYAVLLLWIVLAISYFFTDVSKNINWVFAPVVYHWQGISQFLWLLILFIAIPLFIILPIHLLFIQFF